jgi:hypothetical protein
VIESLPVARLLVVRVAMPVLFSGAVLSTVEPLLNVTVPVGVPPPELDPTLAVKVTLAPAFSCVAETVRVVTAASLTVRATAEEVEEEKVVPPL